MAKVKNILTTPYVDEYMEQLEFLYFVDENINDTANLIKGLAMSYKIKYNPTYD